MAIPRIAGYTMEQALERPDDRTEWTLQPERAVLLVHDMQNYFVNFYERDAEPMRSLLANIAALVGACRASNIPVVYTAQPPDQHPRDRGLLTDFWGGGLTSDGDAAAVVPELRPRKQDIQYVKWRYSAFQRTELEQDLRAQGRDQLLICGIYAHIGVLSTALDAFMRDIKPFVVGDAVADFSPEDHAMAVRYIAGRCGQVVTLESLKAQLTAARSECSLSLEQLTRDVADSLMMPTSDIHPSDNLLDLGLDSIRLMSLVEKWRGAGAKVEFVELAETATLGEWWTLIQSKRGLRSESADNAYA